MNIQDLRRYIEKVATKDLAANHTFKETTAGNIIESNAGYYRVQLKDSSTIIDAKPLVSSDSYAVDDYVYLIQTEINSGDLNERNYFIFGIAENIAEKFVNLTEEERFIAIEGVPVKNDPRGIIEITDPLDRFILTLQHSKILKISAEVMNITNDDETYGLQLVTYKNETAVEEFNFDNNYFIGQPFNLQKSYQSRIIKLENEDFDKIEVTKIVTDISTKREITNLRLEVGELLDISQDLSLEIKLQEGSKEYFLIGTDPDIVKLQAFPKYKNQVLDNSKIKYYWFVEDESITSNSNEGYFNIGGAGWRCLNACEKAVAAVDEFNQVLSNVDIWDPGSKYKEFDATARDTYFTKYETKVKCVVQYQLAIITSNEFKVINYNYHDLSYNLETNSTGNYDKLALRYEDDIITLEAKVNGNTKHPNINGFEYNWSVEGFNDLNIGKNISKIVITDKEENIELIIDDENDTVYLEYPNNVNPLKISLQIDVDFKGGENLDTHLKNQEEEEVTEVDIYSYVYENELHDEEEFYYCESYNPHLKFIKLDTGNPSWTIQRNDFYRLTEDIEINGTKTYYSYNGNEYQVIESPDINKISTYYEQVSDLSSNWLENKPTVPTSNYYYIYYTSRKLTKDYYGNTVLLTGFWSEPKILEMYNDNNSFSYAEVEQLNTFNKLSRNGDEQGIYYTEGEGEGKLYINADYIKTGTLLVGEANNPKFYASMYNDVVSIGGFEVGENYIQSKNYESEVSEEYEKEVLNYGTYQSSMITTMTDIQIKYLVLDPVTGVTEIVNAYLSNSVEIKDPDEETKILRLSSSWTSNLPNTGVWSVIRNSDDNGVLVTGFSSSSSGKFILNNIEFQTEKKTIVLVKDIIPIQGIRIYSPDDANEENALVIQTPFFSLDSQGELVAKAGKIGPFIFAGNSFSNESNSFYFSPTELRLGNNSDEENVIISLNNIQITDEGIFSTEPLNFVSNDLKIASSIGEEEGGLRFLSEAQEEKDIQLVFSLYNYSHGLGTSGKRLHYKLEFAPKYFNNGSFKGLLEDLKIKFSYKTRRYSGEDWISHNPKTFTIYKDVNYPLNINTDIASSTFYIDEEGEYVYRSDEILTGSVPFGVEGIAIKISVTGYSGFWQDSWYEITDIGAADKDNTHIIGSWVSKKIVQRRGTGFSCSLSCSLLPEDFNKYSLGTKEKYFSAVYAKQLWYQPRAGEWALLGYEN